MATKISGTKEWSVCSVNIISGCPHRCRYCYARATALRYNRLKDPEDWGGAFHHLRDAEVRKDRKDCGGTVMFPTTHDITPEYLEACLVVIKKILEAGNRLLIVSKPHLECIEEICDRWGVYYSDYRDQILFRFTIGARDDVILSYWEPGAPGFVERLASLRLAHERGFATSVSCEPLLEAEAVEELFHELEPYVTDTIWIGKMNQVRQRCIPGTSDVEIARIEAGQTHTRIHEIYEALRHEPKVRWKESYKAILGLKLPSEAGLDV